MAASEQVRADQAVPQGARDGLDPGDLARWLAKIARVPPPPEAGLAEPCWLWTGAKDRKGYGKFWVRGFAGIEGEPRRDAGRSGAMVLAHRWGLWAHGVEIPREWHVDHRCRRVACVNPAHVRPLEATVNTADGNRDRGLEWTPAADPFDFLEEFSPLT